MARGRRGRFRGRGRGGGPGYEQIMDTMAANTTPPYLINGTLIITGNAISVASHLDNFNPSTVSLAPPLLPFGQAMQMQMYPEQEPMESILPQQIQPTSSSSVLTQLNITAVGAKIRTGNTCCLVLTMIFGCLIFPLCFMCCAWWKKIVFPAYEINIEFYRSIGRFLRQNPQCNNVTLAVVDNGFDRNKARALFEALEGTGVRGLTFQNRAAQFDHNENEVSEFQANMAQIKALPISASVSWGDMIV